MSESAGEKLRAARESRGLKVEDLAARLRLPARYVRALEQGDLTALPEPTFVRGYLKAYAREMGLDGEALATELVPVVEVKAPRPLVAVDGAASIRKSTTARAPNFRAGSHAGRRFLKMLLLVVPVLAIAVLIVLAVSRPDPTPASTPVQLAPLTGGNAAPVTVAPAATPITGTPVVTSISLPLPAADAVAPAGSAAPVASGAGAAVPLPMPAAVSAGAMAAPVVPEPSAPAAAARRGLFIRFSADSWVEVRDADDRVLHTSTKTNGSVLALDGKAPLTVTLGNTAAAEIWFNGVQQPSRGSSARVGRVIVGQAAR